MRHVSTDKMTDRVSVNFSLSSEEGEFPAVVIVCEKNARGEYENYAIYIGREDLPGPQTAAQVRVDKEDAYIAFWKQFGSYRSARIDIKTARSLLTGQTMLLRLVTLSEQIVEPTFRLAGLDHREVERACGSEIFAGPQ